MAEVLKNGEKHCGKRRNSSLRAISLFPTVFSKALNCSHVKTKAFLGKQLNARTCFRQCNSKLYTLKTQALVQARETTFFDRWSSP